ncbi:MAG: aminotransferase class IV [Gammaproteobacteria bacterium]
MHLPPENPLRAPLPPDWPAPEALGFGQYLGPYLVETQHRDGHWTAPSLTPRAASPVQLASGALQYGLSVFEGLKAYRAPDDRIHLFRPLAHARRLQASAQRLGMPVPPEALCQLLCRLAVQVHAAFVPPHGRGALYPRPTLFAEEECLGLRAAKRHRLSVVVTACSDPPLKSLRLWAEPELIRAAPGGLGAAKTGGNYAAGLGGLLRAKAQGYDDVAWLDAATHTQLGEAGTMNLFVQIGTEVLTPPLDGTILAGVTRDCVIGLLRDAGVSVHEMAVGLDDLATAEAAGQLGAAFGTGTAARVAAIDTIGNGVREIRFRDRGGLAAFVAERLKQLQEGATPRHASWREPVPVPGEAGA